MTTYRLRSTPISIASRTRTTLLVASVSVPLPSIASQALITKVDQRRIQLRPVDQRRPGVARESVTMSMCAKVSDSNWTLLR
jgi:hypothetical protein